MKTYSRPHPNTIYFGGRYIHLEGTERSKILKNGISLSPALGVIVTQFPGTTQTLFVYVPHSAMTAALKRAGLLSVTP